MEIIEKKIEELQPYENNPRNNDAAVESVANSIKAFGWKVPIVIDKNGVIVAGHTRYLAAIDLGIERIPCVVADDLNEEQIKAFRIADNKTAEQASWDMDALGEEFKTIMDDIDMTDFGFGDFELTMLTTDFEPEPYDKEIEEEYEDREKDYLKRERIIINYTEEDIDKVKELLGLKEIAKVLYDIDELWEQK